MSGFTEVEVVVIAILAIVLFWIMVGVDAAGFPFILIAENVLNFHSSDDSYYEEWNEQVADEGGWVVVLEMPKQSQYDFKRSRLTNYIGLLDLPQWRTMKPEVLFNQVDNWMLLQLR